MRVSSPAPVHSVHIYDDAAALISRLCGIVSASLLVGDSVLVVATVEHRHSLVQEMNKGGMEVRDYARSGLFTMLDAGELLSMFMRDSTPDPALFATQVGELLGVARSASRGRNKGLTVFGEMVAVLWAAGNKEAALCLEKLWNDLLNERAFHLHCAYSRAGFADKTEETRVCAAHSHLIAA